MLVHIKQIVGRAQKGKYAVGAFNVYNFETILGVAQAAIACEAPAIIQVSEGAIEYMGLKPTTHIVSTVAKNVAFKVPIALHLDHGKNIDTVLECINAGFSSVHIDASDKPIDENIAITKQIVKIAHARNVWVQGEVGGILGGHGEIGGKIGKIPLANAKEVIRFCKETGVDTIAAAVGTAHGVYTDEKINFKLLAEIKSKVRKPFVLHGGSGISNADIKKAIAMGVCVINIGTDLKIAFVDEIKKSCVKNKKENDPRIILKPAIAAVEKTVSGKIKLFGGAGKYPNQKIEI